MKKLFFFLMAITFTVMLTTIGFAATEDVSNTQVPGSGITTTDDQYSLEDAEIPQGVPNTDSATTKGTETIALEDEATPLAKTGGIPAEAFYVVGGLCIGSALLLTRKKEKSAAK